MVHVNRIIISCHCTTGGTFHLLPDLGWSSLGPIYLRVTHSFLLNDFPFGKFSDSGGSGPCGRMLLISIHCLCRYWAGVRPCSPVTVAKLLCETSLWRTSWWPYSGCRLSIACPTLAWWWRHVWRVTQCLQGYIGPVMSGLVLCPRLMAGPWPHRVTIFGGWVAQCHGGCF